MTQPVQVIAQGTEPVASHDDALMAKLGALEDVLSARPGVLVAYSGGVDSALIAAAAVRALGPYTSAGRGALAVLADSSTLARRELMLARATADQLGVPLHELTYSELDNPDWVRNDANRCYHCKADLATALVRLAPVLGFEPQQIAFGITTSDLGDYRPGIQATRDADAWHPLVDAGLDKAEVRALARHLDLPIWDKPAQPCLASRVQYGESITEATLSRIERGEHALNALGFTVCRLRHHGNLARVEVPRDLVERAAAARDAIVGALRGVGYTYVTLDLQGFRSGAMNEALPGRARAED